MGLDEIIKSRYSVRNYSDKPVEKETFDRIIEAGMLAPTAKNTQAQRIYILCSPEAVAKIRSVCRSAYNAPAVMCFTAKRDEVFRNPFEDNFNSGHQDCSIVATHMMLKAYELGLGTVWVNHFPRQQVRELFEIPEDEEIVLLMPIGYPAAESVPSPRHSESKKPEEVVKFL